jgi:ATP/ADP translocase
VIALGILAAIVHGLWMPLFGSLMGKMLFVMMGINDLDKIREESNFYCALMLSMAICSFVSGFV